MSDDLNSRSSRGIPAGKRLASPVDRADASIAWLVANWMIVNATSIEY